MSEAKTIIVNGRHYDARTGLAVDVTSSTSSSSSAPVKQAVPSTHVHATTQRSQTLNRKTTKRPVVKPKTTGTNMHGIIRNKKPSAHAPTTTPAQFPKFAPHPTIGQPSAKRHTDIGPIAHPHVTKAHAISKAKAEPPLPSVKPEHPSAHHIKQTAINAAVAKTTKHSSTPKKPFLKRHPRAFNIVSASFALLLLGGYLTYINMPSLSVRVAAAQAGINANYPNYRPDGYSLNGMVGYSQGKVQMQFASNGGPQHFTITQAKSAWDSTAVLDNYVTPRAGVRYIPYTERGLTIYTYDTNAAWVNGGILYTIEGDAPLSSEQIRQIATSLL